MTETLSPVLPDEVDAAARKLLERACDKDLAINPDRGPVRIEYLRTAPAMLSEAL